MAFSPEPMPENPIDFRAPPPSPIASGRRSSVANDDVLTEYLEHSLRVPDLVLPDKIFPRQKIVETPPVIDFQSLNYPDTDSIARILGSLSRIGCFQLVNYGIPSDLIKLVLALAAGIFTTPPENRAAVTRSPERPYGFEEVHGEEESEEFVWCRDKSLKLDMESIWPDGYSNFSEKMERVVSKMENVAEKILKVVEENSKERARMYGSEETLVNNGRWKEMVGSVCYFYRHRNNEEGMGGSKYSLGYDVIRMLIRGSDYSHALCLHFSHSSSSSQFHVYSKKGWLSFSPQKHAIIVTVGDQIQIKSGGEYKQVLGRAILENEKEDSISMAFLYSPNSTSMNTCTLTTPRQGKTISLAQQLLFALILTLLYQFFVYVLK